MLWPAWVSSSLGRFYGGNGRQVSSGRRSACPWPRGRLAGKSARLDSRGGVPLPSLTRAVRGPAARGLGGTAYRRELQGHGEQQRQGAALVQETPLGGSLDHIVHRPSRQLEVRFARHELLRSQGETSGREKVDAGGGVQGDGVRVEGAPGFGGDSGFLNRWQVHVQRGTSKIPPPPGKGTSLV